MESNTKTRMLAVAALALLILSIVPTNQARIEWEDKERLHGSRTHGAINERSLPSAPNRDVSQFEVEEAYGYLVVGVHICECGPEHLDVDENVKVHVEGPGGRIYGPWYLTYDEPCHIPVCRDDPPGGGEQIVIVSPPLGSYLLVIEPGPGRSELPPPPNLNSGGAAILTFMAFENSPNLRGNHIWWYYPDGSRVFVEDGGFESWAESDQQIRAWAGATGILWALAGSLGYAALRIHHGGPLRLHKDPRGVAASAVALALFAVLLLATALAMEEPPGLFGGDEVDWAIFAVALIAIWAYAGVLGRRAWRMHKKAQRGTHDAPHGPPRFEQP